MTKFLPFDIEIINNNHSNKESDHIKFLWLTASWESLVECEYESISAQDQYGWFAVLFAAAYHEMGDSAESSKLMQIAKSKNLNADIINRVIFSNLLNTVARAHALKGDGKKARLYFEEALAFVVGSALAKSLVEIRYTSELSSLGLVKDACDKLTTDVAGIDLSARPSVIDAKLNSIKTELELVNHNITLMHQKNQLYTKTSESDNEASFLERLSALSPSQLGQDLWVLEWFSYKRNGFFVEFGATDGVLLSNTFLLEKEFGWAGLLAEPNPKFFEKLQTNRKQVCSNECISSKTGDTVDFVLADEFGGIQDFAAKGMHKEKVKDYENQGKIIKKETVSLNDFLLKHNAPKNIDYLSIDTEGSEYSILHSFPFDKWNIALITVEHNFEAQRGLIFELLSKIGYERIEKQWDDWYYLPLAKQKFW
ncbi:hypothetical protein GTH32_10985 [Alteromonas sp. 345S023]|uniref:Methyltransferase FkbM domain-containing protein n=1 Tax=Alteromonas profundi TaxID=2696062 RepID=A0A7X5LLS9_9ALTE|nr:FkbM family methyltransferase [Alteromonas profundi]NDV91708.1 hypothetical protein [Alteromonas profundi]